MHASIQQRLESTQWLAQQKTYTDLLRKCSIELTTNGRDTIARAATMLPGGMGVYVPKLPRQTLMDKLVQIGHLSEFGLDPIPHIAARQLESEKELDTFLARAVLDSGVRRVLIIGGDHPEPVGPFKNSAAVIGSGILKDHGIESVDVAGYPEKHPRIPLDVLDSDLELKAEMAAEQQLKLSIVTQFSFHPASIVRFCNHVAGLIPGTPVFAGMAGPTSTARLLRYARICGVTNSFKAVNSMGSNAVRLMTNPGPGRHVSSLCEHKDAERAENLKGIHLFSFGGFIESAEWIGDRLEQAGIRSSTGKAEGTV